MLVQRSNIVFYILFSGMIILLMMGTEQSNHIKATTTSDVEVPVYMISTRGNSDYEGIEDQGYGNYSYSNIVSLFEKCPPEIAIFVHGWGSDYDESKELLDRVKMSLENNTYNISLVGFSWNSNVTWGPAKSIANEDGSKLAHFILDFKDDCQYSDVRLTSHSLGARVILSSLNSLHNNSSWNNSNYTITSTHLMGAAVDDEVSKNIQDITSDLTNIDTIKSSFGKAIEEEVDRFYNLYNPEDNVLEPFPFSQDYLDYPLSLFNQISLFYQIYPYFENDTALGQNGKQSGITEVARPPYYDINVQDQIINISNADAAGDHHSLLCSYYPLKFCEVTIKDYDFGLCIGHIFFYDCTVRSGDNHAGYIGFRNLNNKFHLADDGAIDIVVDNWKNQ